MIWCYNSAENQDRGRSEKEINMKGIGVFATLLAFALFFGLLLVGGCQTVSAQKSTVKTTKKEKTAKKADDEDDNDGDNVSADEAKGVAVTLEAARSIALERVKGTVIDEELEKEHGRLQYAFDIKDDNGQVWDVEIHAMTGEVLQAIPDDEDDEDGATTNSKKVVHKKTVKTTAKVATTKPH